MGWVKILNMVKAKESETFVQIANVEESKGSTPNMNWNTSWIEVPWDLLIFKAKFDDSNIDQMEKSLVYLK